MNNALAINEGAEDALLRAMATPLFIKRRQTQRPEDGGSPPPGSGTGMRAHRAFFYEEKLIFFSLSSRVVSLVVFLIIRCVAHKKNLIVVYSLD